MAGGHPERRSASGKQRAGRAGPGRESGTVNGDAGWTGSRVWSGNEEGSHSTGTPCTRLRARRPGGEGGGFLREAPGPQSPSSPQIRSSRLDSICERSHKPYPETNTQSGFAVLSAVNGNALLCHTLFFRNTIGKDERKDKTI